MDAAELQDRLESDLASLTMDRPVAQVVARGRALRRSRRRLPALLLATAAVSTGFALLPDDHQPAAFASWKAAPQATDPATLTTIERNCRAVTPGANAAVPLRVLDQRGTFAFVVFSDNREQFTCELFQGTKAGPNEWQEGGSGDVQPVLHRDQATGTSPISIEGSSGVYVAARGEAVTAHGWITPRVTKVVVRSRGYEMTATINDGLWAAWWPGLAKERTDAPVITATAYDADGQNIGNATLRP